MTYIKIRILILIYDTVFVFTNGQYLLFIYDNAFIIKTSSKIQRSLYFHM